mgnify:CR=1 FL=1
MNCEKSVVCRLLQTAGDELEGPLSGKRAEDDYFEIVVTFVESGQKIVQQLGKTESRRFMLRL